MLIEAETRFPEKNFACPYQFHHHITRLGSCNFFQTTEKKYNFFLKKTLNNYVIL